MEPTEFPTGNRDTDLIVLEQLDTIDLVNLQQLSPYLKRLIQEEFWDKIDDLDGIVTSLKGLNKDNYWIYDNI